MKVSSHLLIVGLTTLFVPIAAGTGSPDAASLSPGATPGSAPVSTRTASPPATREGTAPGSTTGGAPVSAPVSAPASTSASAPASAPVSTRSGTQTPTYTLNAIHDFLASSAFCAEPNRDLCESATYNPQGRNQRVEQLRARLRKKGLEDTAKAIHRDPRTFSEADIAALQPESERERVLRYYYQRVAAWYDFEIGISEFTGMWGNIGKIKGYLKAAIDARLGGTAQQALAAELKQTIDLTIPMDRKWLTVALAQNDPDAPYLARAYVEACGPDGLADNAFAFRPREIRYLIVCPGLLMGAPNGGDVQTADFRNVVQALAHELGHHIDSANFPALYSELEGCLASQHADGLGVAPGSGALAGVRPFMREITADYWATQTIIQYLQTDGQALAKRDRGQVFRESFGALCGSPADGIHPAGRYRIEVLLRGDPAVSRLMGCEPGFRSKPACSLFGVPGL